MAALLKIEEWIRSDSSENKKCVKCFKKFVHWIIHLPSKKKMNHYFLTLGKRKSLSEGVGALIRIRVFEGIITQNE